MDNILKQDELIHDENDIKLLNAIAALHIKFGSDSDARDILELSNFLDSRKPQTLRLSYNLYMRSGMFAKAEKFLKSLGSNLSETVLNLNFADTFKNNSKRK